MIVQIFAIIFEVLFIIVVKPQQLLAVFGFGSLLFAYTPLLAWYALKNSQARIIANLFTIVILCILILNYLFYLSTPPLSSGAEMLIYFISALAFIAISLLIAYLSILPFGLKSIGDVSQANQFKYGITDVGILPFAILTIPFISLNLIIFISRLSLSLKFMYANLAAWIIVFIFLRFYWRSKKNFILKQVPFNDVVSFVNWNKVNIIMYTSIPVMIGLEYFRGWWQISISMMVIMCLMLLTIETIWREVQKHHELL